MPGGKTKFQNSWLEKVDNNGNKLSKWCRKDNKNEYAGFCFVCSKQISCANAGSNQLLNHADGQKHKESMKSRENCAQRKFFVPDPKSSTQGGGDIATKGNIVQLQPMSHRDHVQRAEILWALKIAASGYSYSSCDNIAELFQAMFPGQIANDFTMSKSKISYLISDALGPYFRQELSKRIQESKCMYTVQYDETGNAQDKKQCDVLVRFWNEQQGEVSTMFLKSLLFGHAKGKDVGQALLNTLTEENVPVDFLLFLGSDGPNVNKTIWTYINSHKKSHGYSELVQFIPCTVHVVHNSFRKGLNVFGEDAEELAIDLFRWFKTHSCQREDYSATLEDLGMDDEMFIRHVECRWLTLLPALERVERNWEAAKQYFLKDLPRASREDKTDKYLLKNFRYQRICVKLKSTSTLVEVQFLVNSAPVFNNFLTLFQKQEPLIHILYEESTQLLETFMLRFMKQEVVKGAKGSKLVKLDICDVKNCADLQDMEIGGNTKTTLSKVGSPKERDHST